MNRIFIGYDRIEEGAYHTLVHSILTQATRPVAIIPIVRSHLGGIHDRSLDQKQTNEFTYTRFLTPYLSDFKGWSLFMDSDMLVRGDINELFDLADDRYAVMCVQHPDYESKVRIKNLGVVQHNYPRKNWSSVMLFNNALCKILTPMRVNSADAKYLHRMDWAGGDHLIGALPKEWNHLVGEQDPNPGAMIVHYTLGLPCWPGYESCEYAAEWLQARAGANFIAVFAAAQLNEGTG